MFSLTTAFPFDWTTLLRSRRETVAGINPVALQGVGGCEFINRMLHASGLVMTIEDFCVVNSPHFDLHTPGRGVDHVSCKHRTRVGGCSGDTIGYRLKGFSARVPVLVH